MRLRRGSELRCDADVQLLVADREPDSASRCEQRRLLDLLEPQHVAVERARLLLAPFRSSDLDVVERDDHRESNGCSAPRVTPGPE